MNPDRNQPSNWWIFFRRRFILAGLALLLLSVTGCGMLKFSKSQPKAQINSLQLTNRPTGPVSLDVLQAQIMRFADTYAANVAQACDDITLKTTNPAIRLVVLRWKLGQATSAYHRRHRREPGRQCAGHAGAGQHGADGDRKITGCKLTAMPSGRCSTRSATWRPMRGRWRAACSNRRNNRNCGT